MVEIVSDNIISPLGTTSEENYQNVKAGNTGIRTYDSLFGIEGKVSCSKIDDTLIKSEFDAEVGIDVGYTRLEKLAMISAWKATKAAGIDTSSPGVKLHLSTTKGNVGLLDEMDMYCDKLFLHETAREIAWRLYNKTVPLTISNACISGVNAIIAASRDLEAGRVEYAVVTGVDVLTKFVVAGFSCLNRCRQSPADLSTSTATDLTLARRRLPLYSANQTVKGLMSIL